MTKNTSPENPTPTIIIIFIVLMAIFIAGIFYGINIGKKMKIFAIQHDMEQSQEAYTMKIIHDKSRYMLKSLQLQRELDACKGGKS